MGSLDREYWRDSPERSPARRTWSVTTWLIALCVGIFAIDAFLPRTWQVVGTAWVGDPSLAEAARQGTLTYRVIPVEASPALVASVDQPVVALTPRGPETIVRQRLQSTPPIRKWLSFSTATAIYSSSPGTGFAGLEIWRFIGFQFCHADMNHLIFNMIGLFFFGPIVERFLGARRFLAFYLICGIAGAALYLLLNAAGFAVMQLSGGKPIVPGLLFNDPYTPLVGASAGIFGILIASARIVPNATVLLFFIIPMRLATLAYALVIIAVGTVILGGARSGWNAGGEAAHLGGAIAGWWLIARPEPLQGFFDFFGRAGGSFSGTGARRGAAAAVRAAERRAFEDAEVDRVLDKIKSEGIASLSETERRILKDASRR
ncbi:MAG: rhomboid family intramembrane serine protease [Phycisphaerales bacterium]|nr:rhomboid family intramembrane serine protease [Phycisphaerales bacterium]